MRTTVVIRAVLWAALMSGPAVAEPTTTVDQICAAARRRAIASPGKARIFASILTPRSDPARFLSEEWRAFADRNELAAVVASSTSIANAFLHREAFIWDLPGNSLVVSTFTTSSSGDWTHHVEYCFRADGTLALSHSILSTFVAVDGGVRRIRERRFDRGGQLLWVTSRVIDLETGKARKDQQFMDQDEPIYKNRVDLPFARLL